MSKITVVADQFGNVWQLRCAVGDAVEAGAVLMVLESMKMEVAVTTPEAGTVTEILVTEGDTVEEDQRLAVVER